MPDLVPSALLSPHYPPLTCHKNRWSSAQLVVLGGTQDRMVVSQKKQQQLSVFQLFAFVQPSQPVYFWQRAGAD